MGHGGIGGYDMNDAGRIGFVIKGEYSTDETYDFLDVVYYKGDSYVAKKLTTGNTPQKSDEYWQILAMGVDKDLYVKNTDYATPNKAGIVKPDDKTIKVGSDGTIVGAASGFTGTTAEVEQAIVTGELDDGEIVNITDDYDDLSDVERYATKEYVQEHPVTNMFSVSTEEEMTNALNQIHENTPNNGVSENIIITSVTLQKFQGRFFYVTEAKSNNGYAYQEAKSYGLNNIFTSTKRSLTNGVWGDWYDTSGIVDAELSKTSENAVQNKAVMKRFDSTIEVVAIYYTAESKEGATYKLNNPDTLFPQYDKTYAILFHDTVGDSLLGGGTSLVIGYYADSRYGSQLVLNYFAVCAKRDKINGVWSDFVSLV